jgi:hypothetical protein
MTGRRYMVGARFVSAALALGLQRAAIPVARQRNLLVATGVISIQVGSPPGPVNFKPSVPDGGLFFSGLEMLMSKIADNRQPAARSKAAAREILADQREATFRDMRTKERSADHAKTARLKKLRLAKEACETQISTDVGRKALRKS